MKKKFKERLGTLIKITLLKGFSPIPENRTTKEHHQKIDEIYKEKK